jgi:hypothetical protein
MRQAWRRGSTKEEYSFTGCRRVYIPPSCCSPLCGAGKEEPPGRWRRKPLEPIRRGEVVCGARGKTLQARNGMHGRMGAGRPPRALAGHACESRGGPPEVGVLAVRAVRCGSLEPSPGLAGPSSPLPYVALDPCANIAGASDSTRASVARRASLRLHLPASLRRRPARRGAAAVASREARRPCGATVGPPWANVCSTRTAVERIRGSAVPSHSSRYAAVCPPGACATPKPHPGSQSSSRSPSGIRPRTATRARRRRHHVRRESLASTHPAPMHGAPCERKLLIQPRRACLPLCICSLTRAAVAAPSRKAAHLCSPAPGITPRALALSNTHYECGPVHTLTSETLRLSTSQSSTVTEGQRHGQSRSPAAGNHHAARTARNERGFLFGRSCQFVPAAWSLWQTADVGHYTIFAASLLPRQGLTFHHPWSLAAQITPQCR